jgi:hypothetical protein
MAFLALYQELEADERFGSSRSPSSLTKVNAPAVRKSAEIFDLPLAQLQRGLPTATLPFGDAAGKIIEILFNDTSRHAIAVKAARALGASDDKIERILSGDTKRIDAQLLFRCLALYQARFDKPFDIGGGLGVAIVAVPA